MNVYKLQYINHTVSHRFHIYESKFRPKLQPAVTSYLCTFIFFLYINEPTLINLNEFRSYYKQQISTAYGRKTGISLLWNSPTPATKMLPSIPSPPPVLTDVWPASADWSSTPAWGEFILPWWFWREVSLYSHPGLTSAYSFWDLSILAGDRPILTQGEIMSV